MPGGDGLLRSDDYVRLACGSHRCPLVTGPRRLGRLDDLLDYTWPVLTTALSIIGARRLIGRDRANAELDVIA